MHACIFVMHSLYATIKTKGISFHVELISAYSSMLIVNSLLLHRTNNVIKLPCKVNNHLNIKCIYEFEISFLKAPNFYYNDFRRYNSI